MNYEKRGNPYLRGKTWSYIVYAIDPITGIYRAHTKGGYTTKSQAEQAKEIAKAEITLGLYQKRKITCTDFFDDWFENIHKYTLAYNTYMSYRNCIYNHLIPAIGKKYVVNITRKDILDLLQRMEKQLPSVCKIMKPVLNKGFEYAKKTSLIDVNPAENIRLSSFKRNNHNYATLTDNEICTLIEYARETPIYMDVLLSVTLGLRRGETVGLKYSDIDFKSKTMHIQRTLGKKEMAYSTAHFVHGSKTKQEKNLKTESSNRIISIPDFVFEEILAQREIYESNKQKYEDTFIDDQYICCSETGTPRCTSYLYKPFKKLLKDAGLPNIRWHDLRGTVATSLFLQNADINNISCMLGHISVVTTADYYLDPRSNIPLAIQSIEKKISEMGLS